ncbi:hypothetical protein TNCV_2101061 [Trichonephila clavipes]|nr:hypothetical protein TNCV_2101061 [Trichonephila clavipes]
MRYLQNSNSNKRIHFNLQLIILINSNPQTIETTTMSSVLSVKIFTRTPITKLIPTIAILDPIIISSCARKFLKGLGKERRPWDKPVPRRDGEGATSEEVAPSPSCQPKSVGGNKYDQKLP